ncbi:heterokaryon incompatibility protein-domain-containing protein [Xylariaceae sp. AK1471]|nr:heterokaryon incompatibility protein-domain-containing protein [Xylariaceae sp. AK1471]
MFERYDFQVTTKAIDANTVSLDLGRSLLTPDLASDNDLPSYAILSHTWGPDEVVFTDLAKTRDNWQQKAGYDKIRLCAEQARRCGLRYFWVDTCCIDKSDSIELQTAINSMFRWYRRAKVCYVYLSDVSSTAAAGTQGNVTPWKMAFRDSRWFTRGWTLQELIAPVTVEFYSKEGIWLGNKRSLEPQLRDITGIPASALRGTPLSDFSIAEREAWVRNRQTKYEEDMAYSLLGIFDVYMPLIYGEGRQKAERRLREEAQKVVKETRHNDFSITFSLSEVPEIQHFVAREGELAEMRRTLSSDGSRRVVVLHGLGGIGKTQLAITYAKSAEGRLARHLHTIRHDPASRLIWKPKVDTERRVNVSLDAIIGAFSEDLHILSVEVDDLEVGLDARLGDRLGEHRGAPSDCVVIHQLQYKTGVL